MGIWKKVIYKFDPKGSKFVIIYTKKRSYILLCVFLFSVRMAQKQCCEAALKESLCTNGITSAKRTGVCDFSLFQADPYKVNTAKVCACFFYNVEHTRFIASQKAARHALYKLLPFLMFLSSSSRCVVSAVCSGSWLREGIIPVNYRFPSLFTAGMWHGHAV